MNDTDERTNRKFTEMMMARRPEERLKMGCSMFEFSKQMVLSSILQKDPNLPAFRIRQELFLRFYAHDFKAQDQKKLLRHFENLRGMLNDEL